ncbi:hypothetical protein KEM55_005990 [Ascosphaera atra]|nr:hypothetical protein KEM55_005990 [Ascosphaera atra]
MHLPTSFPLLALAAQLSTYLTPASAHSWIELVTNISPNGTCTGKGYPRGYVSRQEATELGMTYDVQAMYAPSIQNNSLNAKDPICKPAQQTSNVTSYKGQTFNPIKAQSGSWVSLFYEDNGHVTYPWNQKGKQPGGGHVYIYGKKGGGDVSKLTFESIWDPEKHDFKDPGDNDSSGLKLLATRNFDDGYCHQGGGPVKDSNISAYRNQIYKINEQDPLMGVNLWCQSNVKLPQDASDKYTMFWIWNWRTQAHIDPALPDGKDEIYTTCLDVDISGGDDNGGESKEQGSGVINWKRAPNQAPDQVNITDPKQAPPVPSPPPPGYPAKGQQGGVNSGSGSGAAAARAVPVPASSSPAPGGDNGGVAARSPTSPGGAAPAGGSPARRAPAANTFSTLALRSLPTTWNKPFFEGGKRDASSAAPSSAAAERGESRSYPDDAEQLRDEDPTASIMTDPGTVDLTTIKAGKRHELFPGLDEEHHGVVVGL